MRQIEQRQEGEEAKTSRKQQHRDNKHGSQFCKLVEACKRKDLATIQQLVSEHPELLGHHDKHHRNLLHYASILVLDRKQHDKNDDESKDASENYESHRARRSLDCFRFLLARCEPKLCIERDHDGLTVLHLAVISCNVGLVREILLNKQLKVIDDEMSSALACALDKEHHGPLHWAVITNNLKCVKILIEHSGVQLAHQADLNGATPLHYATQTSDYPKYRAQLRQMLKNATSSHNDHPSPLTSSSSSPASNSSSIATPSPLSSSCDSTSAATQKQTRSEIISQAKKKKKLLEQTGTTTQDESRSFDETGSCMTAAAGSSQNLDILRYLVQLAGVNLECRDRDQRTPLLWAASSGNRHAILLLLASGASPLCQDANKLGPLHCAASHGYTDCLECFLSAPSISTTTTTTLPAAQQKQQPVVNQPDNLACTPLFYAVLSGNIDCVELLLDRGARHDWQDVKGRTAGHFAALKGQLNTLKLLESHGANLWLANKQGDLPLHYAIKSGRQQVVAWLLERSPYERAVNAINNTGRAPIHLALLKGNPTMVDFLIRQGANLNQLVKVRDGGNSKSDKDRDKEEKKTSGSSCYHYETALDMAKRLDARDCLELLERTKSAQSAAWVLAHREQQPTTSAIMSEAKRVQTSKSLFDVQADDVGASPIGFETSGSSAEPPVSVSEATAAATSQAQTTRLPKLPARPSALVESAAPQLLSDSTNSSALSQSSLTSVRGARPQAANHHHREPARENQRDLREGPQAKLGQANRGGESQQRTTAAAGTRRPYRGGINYHNERINASIKCKLYENSPPAQERGHSFPQLNDQARRHDQAGQSRYHSAGSLSAGQQEIITNVNVYTTSPHCPHCVEHEHEDEGPGECRECSTIGGGQRRAQTCDTAHPQTTGGGRRRSSGAATRVHPPQHPHRQQHEFSETSPDTSDAASEIFYDEDSDRSDPERAYLPPLTTTTTTTGGPAEKSAAASSQQQVVRYLPPSQAYTQHLPVILSAEEERSTSGDTSNTADGRQQRQEHSQSVSPGDVDAKRQASPVRPLDHQAQRSRRAQLRHRDEEQVYVRSPVAEYIRGVGGHESDHRQHHPNQRAVSMGPRTGSDVRGWSQHDQSRARAMTDYSQVRAKVDSHRNDSGLSMSHFGDDPDGAGSSVGRRSKSWSTLDSQHPLGQPLVGGGQDNAHLQQQTSGYSPSPIHQEQEEDGEGEDGGPGMRSCSRQTIIRTRRLSVDSVELASSVERSIWKYKQENKLFEELQNLKRSQIRSGRANEALLVKRLVERFRHEIQRDTLMSLDSYHGPYTYQAYELYLYDQLRKISHSNQAKLAGARVPHKFTYQEPSGGPGTVPLGSSQPARATAAAAAAAAANYEARDYFDEDLKAELELQRVIQRSEAQTGMEPLAQATDLVANQSDILIEPSGALEDIRVLRHHSVEEQDVQTSSSHEDNDKQEQQLQQVRGESLVELGRDESLSLEDQVQPEVEMRCEDRQEQEEPASPRAGRAFAGSSTASSRRSSIDVERDKLESLPLRVASDHRHGDFEQTELGALASEKERRQIEAQAQDLTAAIITDALGNVSRASSPVGQRKRPAHDDEVEHASEIVQSFDDDDDATQESTRDDPKTKPQHDSQPTTAAAAATHGRRRSVVNIGNKMEVIYHNVGIEIDTVGENPPSDEDEPTQPAADVTAIAPGGDVSQPPDQGDEPKYQTTAEPDQAAAKLERVHEHEEGDDEDLESSLQEHRPHTEDAREELNTCETGEKKQAQEPMDEEQQAADSLEQRDDDQQQGDSAAHTPSSSIVALEPEELNRRLNALDRPSATFTRRASSPPGPQGSTTSRERKPLAAAGRRVSADSSHRQQPSTSDMIVVQRKVFNGFDLDTLHAHRRKALAREQSIATSSDAQSNQQPESTSGSKLRPAKTPVAKPKPRLERSRPPAGPYKVYVPTELIHERWLEVKRHEKQQQKRLGELGEECGKVAPSIKDEFENVTNRNNQLVASDSASGINESISHAKSQPNLERELEPSGQLGRETSADHAKHHGECSNFILIYELNKSTREHEARRIASEVERAKEEETEIERRAQIKQVNWCQRRITRIVDVRTLKRTLSLPECLIYSNDLLKRFSILKL